MSCLVDVWSQVMDGVVIRSEAHVNGARFRMFQLYRFALLMKLLALLEVNMQACITVMADV